MGGMPLRGGPDHGGPSPDLTTPGGVHGTGNAGLANTARLAA